MTMKVGSDRRASADHNNFTKNKVRQGESEGWITGLGLQPRLYLLLQSKQNEEKSAETVGRRGSIQLSLLSTPTSQPAKPPFRSCVSNDNSKCMESQKLLDSSRSVTNPNPCSRQKYTIFGQATDDDCGGRGLCDFGESEITGDQAQPSMRE